MNRAFRYYGKTPSTEMQQEALKVQGRFMLNDLQLAGLLRIHDFFQRIALFDCSIYDLELIEYGSRGQRKNMIPLKTIEYFSEFTKCSDAFEYFNNSNGYRSFYSFANKLLQEKFKDSDYIAPGLLARKQRVETTIEYSY